MVLVLLPPSETKAAGGTGPALDLPALSRPELTPVRALLVDALVDLAGDVPAARDALRLGPRQDDEIRRNAELRTAPTLPALLRYTGVLYDALDVRSMTGAQRARASRRLAVGSALFGLVAADDPVPAYRLSAGSALPALPGLRTLWRPLLSPALDAVDDLVVDLRSGAYAALAPVRSAVPVQVVTERPGGSRAVVGHTNKGTKGRLARHLATTTAEPDDPGRLAALLRRAGFRVERQSAALTVVVQTTS